MKSATEKKQEAAKPRETGTRRAEICRVLQESAGELPLSEIVARTGLKYNNVRSVLSEMVAARLVVRTGRGIYDLPGRARQRRPTPAARALKKILLNQQILRVLLNIVITNKALMEALLAGQFEIIRSIGILHGGNPESEETLRQLENVFTERVKWHFETAARQVVEQYTRLPAEVLDVLVAPLTREGDEAPMQPILDPVRKKAAPEA